MIPSDFSVEGYYHSALEACSQASQLETQDRLDDALTEYRRSIALIETMRQLFGDNDHGLDQAYFSGVDDVEGICRIHIAKLEGELPMFGTPTERGHLVRRNSSDSVNTTSSTGLTRTGSGPPSKGTGTGRSTGRSKTSRTPSPEKKEKKPMPLSLRPSGPISSRNSSADNPGAISASQAAVKASRAATLAWQSKKPDGAIEQKRVRIPSSTLSRAGSVDSRQSNVKRPSIPDTVSLLDTPLIDFSAPVLDTSTISVLQESNTAYSPVSPTPPHSPTTHSSPHQLPRRKTPLKELGRSKAVVSRPAKAPRQPASPSAPLPAASATELSESIDAREDPPISVSIPGSISLEQERSREEQAIKDLKGVDEALARTILNDIIVHGDEVQWDDIAGLEEAKSALKETVIYPFIRPDLFSGLREPARGMLLFGPPGTGKTMLARAVATQAKSTFFSVSASTLVSKYLGESEKLVKALFTLAKALSPSVIFVDEIDSLLSSRNGGDHENEASRRLKTEFLIQWSSLASAAAARADSAGPRVLVLAATNLPWAIDDAARRRFVLRQYIPLPEAETRRVQFMTLLSKQHHTLTDEQLSQLVSMSEGFSGSDITALTKDAAMGPLRSLGEALLTMKREEIRPIGFEDFVTSLRKIRPSVGKRALHAFEKWNDEFGSKG